MTQYFILAGEASGDLHGRELMRALKGIDPSLSLRGVGGPRMRREGLLVDLPMEEFQVMGFSAVLKQLPRLWKHFFYLRDLIIEAKPSAVILIDYPGFNLRLARALRQKGFKGKLVQYICPSVWAHGKKRIQTLISSFDLLLTIFPFEASYFSQSPLKVEYIGHPLVETIHNHSYEASWASQVGLSSTAHLVAFFPGSRSAEIKRHLPLQLKVAALLKEKHPEIQLAFSCSPEIFYEHAPNHFPQDLCLVPSHYNYELMQACRVAIAKSGTVTLELALHHVPTVVHYSLSSFDYLIAKYILRLSLPHYCIVNLLSNKEVFPELMARDLSPSTLSLQASSLQRRK